MSTAATSKLPERRDEQRFLLAADVPADDHDGVVRPDAAQHGDGVGQLTGSRPGRRVVDGQHQVGLGDGPEPGLDDVPGLAPIGQREHREVATQGRTGPRGDRLRRGHPGQHPDRHPRIPRILRRLVHRGRHPEHTRHRRRRPPRPAPRRGPGPARNAPGPPRPCCRMRAAAGLLAAAPGSRRARIRPRDRTPARAAVTSGVIQASGPGPSPTTSNSAGAPARAGSTDLDSSAAASSPPRRPLPGTMTIEKYGTAAGSTSTTGSTDSCASLDARSTYTASSSRPACASASRTAGNVRPSFMIAAPCVSASRRASSGVGSVPGSTVSTSSCRTSGVPAAAAAADTEVTPGTTSVGNRPLSRSCRYM